MLQGVFYSIAGDLVGEAFVQRIGRALVLLIECSQHPCGGLRGGCATQPAHAQDYEHGRVNCPQAELGHAANHWARRQPNGDKGARACHGDCCEQDGSTVGGARFRLDHIAHLVCIP